MSRPYIILVHCGGTICTNQFGVDYYGGVNVVVKLRRRCDYDQLLSHISAKFQLGCNRRVSRVTYRYPTTVQGSGPYGTVEIKDDSGVELFFDIYEQHPELTVIELYVEFETFPSAESSVCDIPSSSQGVENSGAFPLAAINNYATTDDDEVDPEWVEDDDADDDDDDDDGDDDSDHGTYSPPAEHFHRIECGSMDAVDDLGPENQWDASEELHKGLVFPSKDYVKHVVKQYHIQRNKEYIVVESHPTVWSIKCKRLDSGCQWRL